MLASQGLRSRVVPLARGFALQVSSEDAERADRALLEWEIENPPPTPPRPDPPLYAGASAWRVAVLVSTALLVTFRASTTPDGADWVARGAADAERILSLLADGGG